MTFMPGNIAKGPLFYYLDTISRSDASIERLTRLLEALQGLGPTYRGLVPVLAQHVLTDFTLRQELSDHMNQVWFNDQTGWWPEEQPIEPIFCLGLIKTLEEALNNPLTIADPATPGGRRRTLPIDSYWLGGCSNFEMTVCRSPQQVTLLVMTPTPPNRRSGVLAEDALVWVVRRDTVHGEELQSPQAVQGGEVQRVREGRVENESIERQQIATNRIITVRINSRPANP